MVTGRCRFSLESRRPRRLGAARNEPSRPYVTSNVRPITNPRLLILKAALFLLLALAAAAILIADAPHLSTVTLLAITIWAFARAYYFAF